MIIKVLHVIFDNDEGVIDCLISGEEKQTPNRLSLLSYICNSGKQYA